MEVRTTEAYLSASSKATIAPGSPCLSPDTQGYQCMPPFVSMLSTESTKRAMSSLRCESTLRQLFCDPTSLTIHYKVTTELGVTQVEIKPHISNEYTVSVACIVVYICVKMSLQIY